jgi:urease accessory protein
MKMDGLGTLLVLADGRLPAGGHAHSGGLEAAVAAGRVRDMSTVESFLRGRLATTGRVNAAFAAAAAHAGLSTLVTLDAELDARTPSPALRRASRAQGRALVRAGRAMWALPTIPGAPGPHHPIALGAIAGAAGLSGEQAALVAAYGSISGPASAAVRLLGLDPYPVHGLLARLATDCERVASSIVDGTLPAAGAPLLDISAEQHATWEVRLFAS